MAAHRHGGTQLGPVIEAEYSVLASLPPKTMVPAPFAVDGPVHAVPCEAKGLEMLRPRRRHGALAVWFGQPGGLAFWLSGMAAAALAFWVAGGHALFLG